MATIVLSWSDGRRSTIEIKQDGKSVDVGGKHSGCAVELEFLSSPRYLFLLSLFEGEVWIEPSEAAAETVSCRYPGQASVALKRARPLFEGVVLKVGDQSVDVESITMAQRESVTHLEDKVVEAGAGSGEAAAEEMEVDQHEAGGDETQVLEEDDVSALLGKYAVDEAEETPRKERELESQKERETQRVSDSPVVVADEDALLEKWASEGEPAAETSKQQLTAHKDSAEEEEFEVMDNASGASQSTNSDVEPEEKPEEVEEQKESEEKEEKRERNEAIETAVSSKEGQATKESSEEAVLSAAVAAEEKKEKKESQKEKTEKQEAREKKEDLLPLQETPVKAEMRETEAPKTTDIEADVREEEQEVLSSGGQMPGSKKGGKKTAARKAREKQPRTIEKESSDTLGSKDVIEESKVEESTADERMTEERQVQEDKDATSIARRPRGRRERQTEEKIVEEVIPEGDDKSGQDQKEIAPKKRGRTKQSGVKKEDKEDSVKSKAEGLSTSIDISPEKDGSTESTKTAEKAAVEQPEVAQQKAPARLQKKGRGGSKRKTVEEEKSSATHVSEGAENATGVESKTAKKDEPTTPTEAQTNESTRTRWEDVKAVVSGLSEKDGNKVKRALADAGASVVESASEATHIVVATLVRTAKSLISVARGIHVVTPEWALEGSKTKKSGKGGRGTKGNASQDSSSSAFAPDELEYRPKQTDKEKEEFDLDKTLANVKEHGGVLSGMGVYATKSTKPPPEALENIVTAANGTFMGVWRKGAKFDAGSREGRDGPGNIIIATAADQKALEAEKLSEYAFDPELLLSGVMKYELEWSKHALFSGASADKDESKGSKKRGSDDRTPTKAKRRRT